MRIDVEEEEGGEEEEDGFVMLSMSIMRKMTIKILMLMTKIKILKCTNSKNQLFDHGKNANTGADDVHQEDDDYCVCPK